MRQVSGLQVKDALEQGFRQWSLPLRVRADNGPPLAYTSERGLPSPLTLWLVALGIEVVFNRPHCPQQNGTVECAQRISSNWSNPKACHGSEALQLALDRTSTDHVEVYRIRSMKDMTRKEIYPGLFRNERKYDPDALNLGAVKQFLSGFTLVRKVFSNGRVSLFGIQQQVGMSCRGENVFLRFDPDVSSWKVNLSDGTYVRHILTCAITAEAIKSLSLFSKNLTT
jgi:transposase InsO family protein